MVRLGLKLAEGVIQGSNARCVAMLEAFKAVVAEYERPPDQQFSRDLDKRLKPQIRFLIDCRPQSISMGNAVSFLKTKVHQVPHDISDEQAKDGLIRAMDDFIQERIVYADRIIAKTGADRISQGDTILVYARSNAVEMVLRTAWEQGKKFSVIVADSRPKFEGKFLAERFSNLGIPCTYVLISSVASVIRNVTRVFVGAHGLLSNGAAVSRVGTAIIAMLANTFNVPLIVCCETYKFHYRAQVDAITTNELGDPDDLIALPVAHLDSNGRSRNFLADWRDMSSLKLLNLLYDLTPPEYISMVITEVGEIPPTAVPVIVREYMSDLVSSI